MRRVAWCLGRSSEGVRCRVVARVVRVRHGKPICQSENNKEVIVPVSLPHLPKSIY